jgi:hypothetical protein
MGGTMVFLVLLGSAPRSAAGNDLPGIGDPFVTPVPATVGIVAVDNSGYDANFRLESPPNILDWTRIGSTGSLNLGEFDAGTELVFRAHVLVYPDPDPRNYDFFTGPGSRNPDGLAHAKVRWLDASRCIIGFEDVLGRLGDDDFNDFLIAAGVHPIPEPGTLALVAVGVTVAGSWVRGTRRTNARH